MSEATAVPGSWRLHDFLVGILAGGGLGAIVGVFLAARVFDSDLVIGAAALAGALVGVLVMMQTRRSHQGFWTVTVIVMWIIAVASIAFLALLYDAIRNFS